MDWLHWVDETFSTYKPESEVCRFDRGELQIGDCGQELRHVFALCHRFNEGNGRLFRCLGGWPRSTRAGW